jgi:glucokinase
MIKFGWDALIPSETVLFPLPGRPVIQRAIEFTPSAGIAPSLPHGYVIITEILRSSGGMSKEIYAIGVDLGGTSLRVALVSREGEIIQKVKVPSFDKIEESLVASIEKVFVDEVSGVGIGAAGLVDRETNTFAVSSNIPAIEGAHLVERLRERFGVPVFIENDANVAVLGEKWRGAGRGFRNIVLFTLGTGIGGGIIYDDSLVHVSAEIGHMSIIANGVKCVCGNYGCLESYASARAILGNAIKAFEKGSDSVLKSYHQGNIYRITPEEIYNAALDGDNVSREALREAGRYLGVGIANMINLLSPDAIILAGGLVGAWNIYILEAIKEASRRAFKHLFSGVKIISSSLGDNSGIVGAAYLVFNSVS